jgi:hypothetical protein
MPPVGFEPVIPASEWPQTHAFDRAATWVGIIHTFESKVISTPTYGIEYRNVATK